jgi:hypothetical protein
MVKRNPSISKLKEKQNPSIEIPQVYLKVVLQFITMALIYTKIPVLKA